MSEKAVKIFSIPTWPHCKTAKSFLESKNIPYQDINVAEDKAARDEMFEKSGSMSVPVFEIDGEILVGFDQEQIKEKLGI